MQMSSLLFTKTERAVLRFCRLTDLARSVSTLVPAYGVASLCQTVVFSDGLLKCRSVIEPYFDSYETAWQAISEFGMCSG
jgi:hypothetical protein